MFYIFFFLFIIKRFQYCDPFGLCMVRSPVGCRTWSTIGHRGRKLKAIAKTRQKCLLFRFCYLLQTCNEATLFSLFVFRTSSSILLNCFSIRIRAKLVDRGQVTSRFVFDEFAQCVCVYTFLKSSAFRLTNTNHNDRPPV